MERIARKLAAKSRHAWAHHVAFIVRGGNIIAAGWNGITEHAECRAAFLALSAETADLRGCKLYSFRFTRARAKLAMAKPCDTCQRKLQNLGLRTVWYSTDAGEMEMMRL